MNIMHMIIYNKISSVKYACQVKLNMLQSNDIIY